MMIPRQADAAEVLQDVSVLLWKKWDQYDPAFDESTDVRRRRLRMAAKGFDVVVQVVANDEEDVGFFFCRTLAEEGDSGDDQKKGD